MHKPTEFLRCGVQVVLKSVKSEVNDRNEMEHQRQMDNFITLVSCLIAKPRGFTNRDT